MSGEIRYSHSEGDTGYTSQILVPYVSGGNRIYGGIVNGEGVTLRESANASSADKKASIPMGTCVTIMAKNPTTDSDGNSWFHVGFTLGTVCWHGYIDSDYITRLYMGPCSGKTISTGKLYEKPSADSTVLISLGAASTVAIRGVCTRNSGADVWYAVLNGTEFAYLPASDVEITESSTVYVATSESFTEPLGGLQENIFKFVGDPAADKKLTKTLDIQGKSGDTYMVNAWGRGTTLPETDNDTARRFGVEVIFVSADGTKDTHYTNFSPDILDWQFLSDVYVAKNDYTSIRISYTYCHNANMAFFDGLSLFREGFGQTYTYDEEGNVISVVDAQKKATEFEYNSTNDMTGIIDANGNKFTYVYDSRHNVTKGTSAQGIVYKLAYDSAGNVTKSGCVDPAAEANGIWMERTLTSDKNHVSSVTDAQGNRVEYTWDTSKDLLTAMKDGRGNTISYGYDSANRLTSVSQEVTIGGEKKTIANAYAYTNDKLASIDHNGFRYAFAHDAFGNTLSASVAGTEVVGYTYDSNNGNLLKTLYGNGDYIRYTYDDQPSVREDLYHVLRSPGPSDGRDGRAGKCLRVHL